MGARHFYPPKSPLRIRKPDIPLIVPRLALRLEESSPLVKRGDGSRCSRQKASRAAVGIRGSSSEQPEKGEQVSRRGFSSFSLASACQGRFPQPLHVAHRG